MNQIIKVSKILKTRASKCKKRIAKRVLLDVKQFSACIYLFKVNNGNTRTISRIWSKLTLPVPVPDEEKKLSYIFIFTLLYGASKGFMNASKAFMKPFEAPPRSVKIKM